MGSIRSAIYHLDLNHHTFEPNQLYTFRILQPFRATTRAWNHNKHPLFEAEAACADTGEMVMLCVGEANKNIIERFRALYPKHLTRIRRPPKGNYQCFVGVDIDTVPEPQSLPIPTGKVLEQLNAFLRDREIAEAEFKSACEKAARRRDEQIKSDFSYACKQAPEVALYASV